MPRKPVLRAAAASLVLGMPAHAATPDEDLLFQEPPPDSGEILLAEPLSDPIQDIPFQLDPGDEDLFHGIDYAQTWSGGTGNDGITSSPRDTPGLGNRVQPKVQTQPRMEQPRLKSQPQVQGADRKKKRKKK